MNILVSLRNLIKRWMLKETKPLINLDLQLERIGLRMHYNPVFCPVCFTQGMIRRMQGFISDDEFMDRYVNPMPVRRANIPLFEKGVPIREDVALKCDICRHSLHHGNPMSEQEAKEEIYLRGSPYFMTPTYSFKQRKSDPINERLRALGYGFIKK